MSVRSPALLLVILTTVCTQGHPGAPAGTARNARERLEMLGSEWSQTPATITYSTQTHAPGETTSPHQCLRQMFGGEIDRPTAVRMCARQGVLRLTWDPPDRWRMDVTTPNEAYVVISIPGGSLRCDGDDGEVSDCIRRTSRQAQTESPFRWVLWTPHRILARIGAERPGDVIRARDRTIGDIRAECFWASGVSDQEAGWCLSTSGIPLFLTTRTADGWSATLEAADVSTGVTEADLSLPTT
jgi:hypothetical protein